MNFKVSFRISALNHPRFHIRTNYDKVSHIAGTNGCNRCHRGEWFIERDLTLFSSEELIMPSICRACK